MTVVSKDNIDHISHCTKENDLLPVVMPALIAQVIGMRRNIPTQPKPLPHAHTSCATVGPDGLLVGSVVHVTEEIALAEDVRPDGLG